jgi:transcriptional regulator with XRE-family HTH domain
MQFERNIKENLGNNLTRLRESKGLTQTELADSLAQQHRIALTRSNVAAYETKAAVPKIETLYAYSRFFGCSIDYLVADPDVPKEEVYVMEATLKEWVAQYSETLDGYRFYKRLCGNMLREVQNADDEVKEGKPFRPLMERLRKVHANMVMERDPALRNFLRDELTQDEREVYEASHAGESMYAISRKKNADEKTIFALLEKANAKIRDFIDTFSL